MFKVLLGEGGTVVVSGFAVSSGPASTCSCLWMSGMFQQGDVGRKKAAYLLII